MAIAVIPKISPTVWIIGLEPLHAVSDPIPFNGRRAVRYPGRWTVARTAVIAGPRIVARSIRGG
jgi:hypothetical protein